MSMAVIFSILCILALTAHSYRFVHATSLIQKTGRISNELNKQAGRLEQRGQFHGAVSSSKLQGGGGLKEGEKKSNLKLIAIAGGIATIAAIYAFTHHIDISGLLEATVAKIGELGPYGYVYFALVYILAEILAIPAVPLTASSGYLFGLVPGTVVVLTSATIAACISFLIGRTYLRSWAQGFISESPRWRAIDKAIAKEGFKVILLLRLSPLLPFAISNYLYGVTSVDFASFLGATFLGFAPGSFGLVYFGSAGKSMFAEGGLSSLPWYAYAGAGLIIALVGQTIAKIATDAVKQMELEQSDGEAASANLPVGKKK